MDYLTGLRVFSAVVRHRGFASAARVLGLSRSSVSKHVDQLERRLGTRLVHRDPHRVSCTAAGLEFFAEIEPALELLDRAERRASGASSRPEGTLKLGAPDEFAAVHIAPHLDELRQRYPDLVLDIRRSECGRAIAEDGLDLAIWVAGALPPLAMVARQLASARQVLCASPEYVSRRGAPGDPSELRTHAIIEYTAVRPRAQVSREVTPATPHGKATLRTDSLEVAKSAVLSGAGICELPVFAVCADLRSRRLVTLLDAWQRPARGIFAVYPDRRYLPATGRALIDFLSEKLAAGGDGAECLGRLDMQPSLDRSTKGSNGMSAHADLASSLETATCAMSAATDT